MKSRFEKEPVELDKAISDPAAVFTAPEDVVLDTRLNLSEKLEVLKRWAHDADLLAVAESEGMGGGEPAMQSRVLKALGEIEQQLAPDGAPAPRKEERLGRE